MSAIFISYRREDSEGHAGRLLDELQTHFGKDKVFMDVSSIGLGRDFREVIDQSVATCDVLLAIIGSRWLDVLAASGLRRIDDAGDFVRLETASALRRGIPVVPVLVQGAKMPAEADLPDDLKGLAYRNGMALSHAHWESDVALLIESLHKIVAGNSPAGPSVEPPSDKPALARHNGIPGGERAETHPSTVAEPMPSVQTGQPGVDSRPASPIASRKRVPLIGIGIVVVAGTAASWYWFGGHAPASLPQAAPSPAPASAPAPAPVAVDVNAPASVPAFVPAPASSKTLPPEPVDVSAPVSSRSSANEIQALLTRMNSAEKNARRSATAQLMEQFSTSTEAIALAISALDDRQRVLRVEGRINVLTYLERSDLGAWTDAQRSSAQAVLARLRATSSELGLGDQAWSLIRKLSNKLGS